MKKNFTLLIADRNPNVRTFLQREAEIAKGLALGADAYIIKPFSNAELVAKVKELLGKTYEEAGG